MAETTGNCKLKLPPAATASVEPEKKKEYLKALQLADKGDLSALTEIWLHRLLKAVTEDKNEEAKEKSKDASHKNRRNP